MNRMAAWKTELSRPLKGSVEWLWFESSHRRLNRTLHSRQMSVEKISVGAAASTLLPLSLPSSLTTQQEEEEEEEEEGTSAPPLSLSLSLSGSLSLSPPSSFPPCWHPPSIHTVAFFSGASSSLADSLGAVDADATRSPEEPRRNKLPLADGAADTCGKWRKRRSGRRRRRRSSQLLEYWKLLFQESWKNRPRILEWLERIVKRAIKDRLELPPSVRFQGILKRILADPHKNPPGGLDWIPLPPPPPPSPLPPPK